MIRIFLEIPIAGQWRITWHYSFDKKSIAFLLSTNVTLIICPYFSMPSITCTNLLSKWISFIPFISMSSFLFIFVSWLFQSTNFRWVWSGLLSAYLKEKKKTVNKMWILKRKLDCFLLPFYPFARLPHKKSDQSNPIHYNTAFHCCFHKFVLKMTNEKQWQCLLKKC